eukprot:5228142-Amphidinium_carterae.2
MKIADDNKRKEEYRKEFLREHEEEEKQEGKTERTRRTGSSISSSSSSSFYYMEPQAKQVLPSEPTKPTRPPLTTQEKKHTVPHTPGQGRPELSPRLRLDPKNFRNDLVQRDDSYLCYYEKKIFEELRQRSYITQHPTSQYSKSTEENQEGLLGEAETTTTTRRRRSRRVYKLNDIATAITQHEFALRTTLLQDTDNAEAR